MPLECVDHLLPKQCQQTIDKIISPIHKMTKEWKDGGLCPNCALNYKLLDFDACEVEFAKLIEGVFSEKE